jgi:hypothetical protein
MSKPDFLLGHEPVGGRINVRRELRRIRADPMLPLLDLIGTEKFAILSSDKSRYEEAYWFYYLSLDRYLHEMSVAARYSKGPYWVRRSGGKARYTSLDQSLANQYRKAAPFLEYDLVNCLIHSRILLDRVTALARHFLKGKRLPSFTSFNDHRKFFLNLSESYGAHDTYARYIREQTEWFEMPLKAVRDKFVVHAGPKHMRFLGYPDGGWELDLIIILPDSDDPSKPLSKIKHIGVNAIRLSREIQGFLKWFCEYGVFSINQTTHNMAFNRTRKSDAPVTSIR